eukprot:TRINITY_DN3770_c0_g1_i1.p1 TRINITY_DN3770_c0_g1~~TRINITY_DN3770_c0_g1_i1.p1  ORF type:complete len:417 (+),score=56.80 TRINITY_DN3770_c0_g1_i1:73-1323(+)
MKGGASVQINATYDDEKVDERRPLLDPNCTSTPEVVAEDSKKQKENIKHHEIIVGLLVLGVIVTGSLNKVSSKIMSEPMANYSFFLSLFNSIAYILLYYGILLFRYYTGKVPEGQMTYPYRRMPRDPTAGALKNKLWSTLPPLKYFIIIGFMDSFGNILGLIAQPYLSGPMISLVQQSMVVFSIICAILILGTRYTWGQFGSAAVVIIGASIAFMPNLLKEPGSDHNPISYALLMSFSNLPSAISFTIKELIFKREKNLELFVVNSTGSLFQLIWFPAMIPITLLLKQTNGMPLLPYIKNGFLCFAGITPEADQNPLNPNRCHPDPYPYLIYIVFNLGYNIFILLLLKQASALQSFMAIKAVLPISVFLFLIKWPLIGASGIDQFTVYSLIIILIGLGLFRYSTILKERKLKKINE